MEGVPAVFIKQAIEHVNEDGLLLSLVYYSKLAWFKEWVVNNEDQMGPSLVLLVKIGTYYWKIYFNFCLKMDKYNLYCKQPNKNIFNHSDFVSIFLFGTCGTM